MRKQTFDFRFNARPEIVYRALLNPKLLPKWRVPDDMTLQVHEFTPEEGGKFRISLTYDDPSTAEKSVLHTDTYRGYFKTLIPNEKIVEVIEFETDNPEFAGEMTVTT